MTLGPWEQKRGHSANRESDTGMRKNDNYNRRGPGPEDNHAGNPGGKDRYALAAGSIGGESWKCGFVRTKIPKAKLVFRVRCQQIKVKILRRLLTGLLQCSSNSLCFVIQKIDLMRRVNRRSGTAGRWVAGGEQVD